MEPSFVTIPFERTIKLNKSDLECLVATNGCYTSPDYTVCEFSNLRYCITFYPNGNQYSTHGHTWIFLHFRFGIAEKIESDVDFAVASANFLKNKKASYALCKNPIGWGVMICTKADLFDETKKYMVYGEMMVKISGTLKAYFQAKPRYLISTQWKIKKSDLDASKANMVSTSPFSISSAPGIKYWLELFPSGCTPENSAKNAWIFVFLSRENTTIIEANLHITVGSVKFSRKLIQTYGNDEERGWGFSLCSTKDLFNDANQYFVNGELNVKVVGTLLIEKEREPTVMICEKGIVPKGYHRNRNFVFVIGEKCIKVHKHVLKAASPVFTGMFNSGMKEVKEKKMLIIDFEYEIVHAAMKLIYSSSIPTSFTFEQMLSLLQFSDKYDIQLIKELVEDYLIQRISPTNLSHLITFTLTTVNAIKLQSKCKEYLVKCLKEEQVIYGYETLDEKFVFQAFKDAFVRNL